MHRADNAMRRGRREAYVESILQAVPVLPFTLEVARVHSRLWADLAQRGQMIEANDLIIAATALAHGLDLVTQNRRHFERVEGLRLTLW